MFEKIKDFIGSNYYFILGVGAMIFIVIVIILLLKKKIKLVNVMKLISMIPAFVNSAENVFPVGQGATKLKIVNDFVNSYAEKLHITKYLKFINVDAIVEDILHAPQKKGVVSYAEKTNVSQT